jgi:hypothetical protein
LSIDVQSARHAISEDIYGMNFANEELATALRLPVRRWGGNSTSRYNWQNDTHNTGSDWYFENIPEDNPNPATLPDGSSADRFVEQDRRTATKTLLTAPLIGWVPKRRLSNHPYDCGFKVSRYGQQGSVDPWDTDCGNGIGSGLMPITGNDPQDTSVQVGPQFVADWVSHLSRRFGTASQGGVAYYNLDNEPMLWNSTHRDVHPQPVSYDEIRDLTYGYAAAIKAVDPTAKTLGPVLWGWCAYFYSAKDGCAVGNDYQTHGSTPFVPWYLQQMRTYEQQHGLRLLDYLDLHYYPQASGVALSSAGNAATQSVRLRSTRSLWDPSYADESWISDTAPGGVAVRLIPRMREWVAANYPGTKLAITEYNWGALDHINGALAQADLLGIFGREGLDLATLWGPPSISQPGAFAFKIYRNYDGAGGGFGDLSVQAASADQDAVGIYAAQRSSDGALTVIIINRTSNDLTSNVSLAGFTPVSESVAYRYSAANPNAIVRLADHVVTVTGFSATFPSNSITLFVMAPGTAPVVALSAAKMGTGAGTITSDPVGIDCGTDCTELYPYGRTVTLTATASPGSAFTGWSGEGCLGTGTCVVSMTQARIIRADFRRVPVNPGDFNADGHPDLLWQDTATGDVYVWLLNGTSVTGGTHLAQGMDPAWHIVGTADFNSDGESDLLWQHETSGDVYVWLMNGTTMTGGTYVARSMGLWRVVGTADLDADGHPDLLWQNAVTGDVYVWFLNGTTLTAGGYLVRSMDVSWKIVATGDFNGDGRPDVVWEHQATGGVYVWYLVGTVVTGGAWVADHMDAAWRVSAAVDLSEDGKPDILWRNTTTGDVYLWIMNGTTVTAGAYVGRGVDRIWRIVGPK